MEQIIISGIIAFLITFYAIPVIIQVADEKKLYDIPDERKVHKAPIPSLGGLAMFGGFLVSLLLTFVSDANSGFLQYYIVSFVIIFFLGVKDDLVVLSPMKKFIGQCMVAAILAFKGKVLITSMHGFLGLEQLDPSASYLLTFFTMIVVINAFNLIDGIDGLAGSVGLITSAVFATYFFINGDLAHALLGFALAGSIAAFLIYNYQPAKIFMGDTGSMLLGVVNAILVIQFIEKGAGFTQYPIHCSPAIGFGILLIPLMDTLRVFGIRIFNRRSPFSPDRNHLHHILLDRGMSHRAIAISIAVASVAFIVLSFFMQPFGTTLMITSLVAMFFGGIFILNMTKPRAQMRVVKNVATSATEIIAEKKPVKLVSLFIKEDRAAVVDED